MGHMHKGYCPGGEAGSEVTCPASCQNLRSESNMKDTENQGVTLHDKAYKGWSHDRTYVIGEKTSGKTPGHTKDNGEAWVKRVLSPGDATDLWHKGSPYHIPGKHMWAGGMAAASGYVRVVLFQPVQ